MKTKFKLEEIKNCVCNYYKIKHSQLISENRKPIFVLARQMYCFISKKYTIETLQDIASKIERDHSTVAYSNKKIKSEIEIYSFLSNDFEQIMALLEKRSSLIPENIDLLRLSENYTRSFL